MYSFSRPSETQANPPPPFLSVRDNGVSRNIALCKCHIRQAKKTGIFLIELQGTSAKDKGDAW